MTSVDLIIDEKVLLGRRAVLQPCVETRVRVALRDFTQAPPNDRPVEQDGAADKLIRLGRGLLGEGKRGGGGYACLFLAPVAAKCIVRFLT